MTLILAGFAWIFDLSHWQSTRLHPSIGVRIVEHLQYSGISILIVVAVALPLGLFIGHTGIGRSFTIPLSNAARALPTLGLLAVLILALGIGLLPTVIVLVILGIPPMLAGVYSGLESVDRQTVDAARAIGMTEWQILVQVEIPLAMSLIIGGLRSAILQVIATVTIASVFGLGGLGYFIEGGIATGDYAQMVAGCILLIALVVIVDGALAGVQRIVVPHGVSLGTTRKNGTISGGMQRPAVPIGAQITEGN